MNTFKIKRNNTFVKKQFLATVLPKAKKGQQQNALCSDDHTISSFHSKLNFGFGKKMTSQQAKKVKSKALFVFSNSSSISKKKHRIFPLFSGKENLKTAPVFFNFSFDKSRLKNTVAWFLETYGQYKTIQLLENLKEFGFGYATKAGLSLGIDDLKIPNNKIALLSKAETKVSKDLMDFRNSKITGIERTQRLIYTWNQTNDMLKQEVIKYFETMDLFNPIYMMAFSGARGNMSQVRQLVGMRGLMSDPQGQIIDFPIQSNFREGLTLTEYLISTYGARKGIVDTALRTATAGYLTRRLVDVAQHVIVSEFDCKTSRGIFLFDMKEANKTIYSFQNRLVGRVLAQDIFAGWPIGSQQKPTINQMNTFDQRQKALIASRNQEIDSKLAFAISKVTKKAFVRSPLTCETPRLVCQLCYGWSLSQGKLVSVGEAVGVIAAQSIGEPGTQLTMRTFHTGGVFAGGLTDQILAPFNGKIQYFHNIPGSCVRISLSEIAFFTKMPGSFFVIRDFENGKQSQNLTFTPYSDETYLLQEVNDWKYKNKNSSFSEIYKIPAYSILFMRNHEFVQKKQVLAQFSTVANKQFQYGSAEQTLYSTLSGEFYLNTSIIPFQKKNEVKKVELIVETRNSDCFDRFSLEFKNDILWKFKDWTNIWILSGKVLYNSFDSNLFIQEGDFLKKTSVFHRILWKKTKNWNLSLFQRENFYKQTKKMFYLKASEISLSAEGKNSQYSDFSNAAAELKSTNTTKVGVQALSFMNLWTSSLKRIDLNKLNFSEKEKTVASFLTLSKKGQMQKSNFTWKTDLNLSACLPVSQQSMVHKRSFAFSQRQTIFTKKQDKSRILNFHIFPLEPFSTNFDFFSLRHKKQNFKHKKFFNSKKHIVFSGTFQKYFVFSSRKKVSASFLPLPKKGQDAKQERYAGVSSKQKKALKHIFFKFSTFGQSSPLFRVYNFVNKFNTSQKFIKPALLPFGQTQKKSWNSLLLRAISQNILYSSQQFFIKKKSKQTNSFTFVQSANTYSYALNSENSKLLKNQFQNLGGARRLNQTALCPTYKPESPQIVLKKILLGFQYEKVRYKKFGYVFSFSDWSTNNLSQYSLRTFTTLKQKSLSENQKVNSGKKQEGLFVGNENFFGKDSSRFLSYCFPKNYQTLTNGIFNISIFENSSKKEKFEKFLCLKEKDFLAKHKFLNNQKIAFAFTQQAKNRKKIFPFGQYSNSKNFLGLENFSVDQKKVTFLVPTSFVSQPLTIRRQADKKSAQFYSCKDNVQKKYFYRKFVFSLAEGKKHKTFQSLSSKTKDLRSFLFFGLDSVENNKFLRLVAGTKVNNSQMYTEEIFWLPQENYIFSIVDFDPIENNTETYVSNQILKKTPFFYCSNRQGKKKPFFPMVEGIWNWSSFLNKAKYRNSFLPLDEGNKKMATPKKTVIEQKISFYKNRNQKLFIEKNIGFPFFSIQKNQKRKNIQKLYLQKKSSFKFLQWKFFLFSADRKNFYKTKGLFVKNSPFFAQKKRRFVKCVSKVYFANKINKKLTKNFISHFQNKKSYAKQKGKNFFTVQSAEFLPTAKLQKKIGQILNFHCFTCLPFQKFAQQAKNSLPLAGGNNKFKEQNKMSQQKNENIPALFASTDFCLPKAKKRLVNNQKFKPSSLQHQKMHIKIQSGWVCYFPNTSFAANNHQSIVNIAHFFGKDLCFEQNKVLRESVLLNSSSISSNLHFSGFKQNKPFAYWPVNDQPKSKTSGLASHFFAELPVGRSAKKPAEGKNLSFYFDVKTQTTEFSIHSFHFTKIKKNSNYRFKNEATTYATQNFSSSFAVNLEFMNKERRVNDSFNSEKREFGVLKDNVKRIATFLPKAKKGHQVKEQQTKKMLALLIRPMQYKLVENPRNYKSVFFNATIQNPALNKNSISFVSSLKIYKKYHSNILNSQKPEKIFLQNVKNVDVIIRSAFEKIHFRRKFKEDSEFSRIYSFKNSTNILKKNRSFSDFALLKKHTIKKFSSFQPESKKRVVSKFQNLLHRDISTDALVLAGQESNAKNQAFFVKNSFFSFHPIQFLPLSVSHSCWTRNDIGSKTSQLRPFLFFNPVNMTMDFSICQNKAAFLNQRIFAFSANAKNVFKKSVETSSFWLNKDGLNFVVPSIVPQNTSFNFWNKQQSKTNSKIKQNKANKNFKVKNQNSKTKKGIFKTFVFQNSQSFYANTKIYSPFQGELISMHMNETNWWKKASEISTIQKFKNLFSVVRKEDLFAIDFACQPKNQPKANSDSKKAKTNQILTLAHENKNFVLSQKNENNSQIRVKYDLKNKQEHLMKLYQSIIKTQQPVLFVDLSKKPEYTHQISSFVTKYENKLYKLKNLNIGSPLLLKNPSLGKFLVYGDSLVNFAIRKPGQIVHYSCFKVTLRRGQPFLVSPNGILHLANTPFIQKNVPILTLPYQTVQSGDIVQGIPKVEQLFEARTTIQGRLFLSSLPILLKGIFERYKSMLPLEQAVRQSFLKIQQLIVDAVQRVYRSQGVSIVDKHLEVIVRQMTTKVQILHGAQTGFFPGELVNLNLVERINKFLLVKIRYEPVVLGITRASLEVESFLSASSFQQTTKILSLAAISRKKDFLKGLKENILVGNLIPSGTGYMVLRKDA